MTLRPSCYPRVSRNVLIFLLVHCCLYVCDLAVFKGDGSVLLSTWTSPLETRTFRSSQVKCCLSETRSPRRGRLVMLAHCFSSFTPYTGSVFCSVTAYIMCILCVCSGCRKAPKSNVIEHGVITAADQRRRCTVKK